MNYIQLQRKIINKELTADEAYLIQLEMLNAKLDPRLVSQRSQGGQTLSYIEAHSAYQILSAIFGQSHWSLTVDELAETAREKREKNGKDQYVSGYSAQCTVKVTFINGVSTSISDVGNGNSIDYQGFHSTTEGAQKEAVSDAFKRCAKSLGNSLGLALYNKNQTMVGYSKYTVLLGGIDLDVVKAIAMETDANKAMTKDFLAAKEKTKLTEFTTEELEELYNKLIA
jgi:DNA recombination protein Rad52